MASINLPALAALIGVTPKTKPWLFKEQFVYPRGRQFARHSLGIKFIAPGPDSPAAFDDWALAPLMRWIEDHTYLHPHIHYYDGTYSCVYWTGKKPGDTKGAQSNRCYTEALLLAARAAGVEQIIALFSYSCDNTHAPIEDES